MPFYDFLVNLSDEIRQLFVTFVEIFPAVLAISFTLAVFIETLKHLLKKR